MTDESHNPRENLKHDKVVLEKTGRHVEVFGSYTKKDLRRLLLSSVSLYPNTDNEQEALEYIGISEDELRNIQNCENISENTQKKLQDLEITDDDIIKEIVKKANDKYDTNFLDKRNSDNFTNQNEEEGKNLINDDNHIEQIEKLFQNREDNFTDCGFSNQLTKDMRNQLLQNGITKDKVRSLENLEFYTENLESLEEFSQQEIKQIVDDSSRSAIAKNSSINDNMSVNNFYLQSNVFAPIKEAICEIILRKPKDPVEFLAHWLLHYKVCEERERKRKECEAELLIEREKSKTEQISDEKEIYYLNENKNQNQNENESENTCDFSDENVTR